MRDDQASLCFGVYANGQVAVLSNADRARHIYMLGKTGTGKSSLLQTMMLADLNAGRAFALLDPHGDLAMAVADQTPADRINDVIYFDPANLAFPLAFNPLSNVSPDHRPLVAAQIVAAFRHVWSGSWGARLEYILTQSLGLLLGAPGSTLLGLPRLLSDDSYRRRLLSHNRDPIILNFWKREFSEYSSRFASEAIAPVQNKVGTLLAAPALRNVLGQVRSTLDMRDIIDEGRVLIVNLAKGRLGETPSHLLGAFITTAFAQAAEQRADVRESDRRPFTLFADEFQNFSTESFAGILSEARKYKLSLVLAHQFLGQLPDLLRQAVIGNAGTVIAFRLGAEDAQPIARELGIESPSALTDLANFEAWTKLLVDGLPTEPRRITMSAPEPITVSRLDRVRNRTQARYGRPRAIIEAKIARFLMPPSL